MMTNIMIFAALAVLWLAGPAWAQDDTAGDEVGPDAEADAPEPRRTVDGGRLTPVAGHRVTIAGEDGEFLIFGTIAPPLGALCSGRNGVYDCGASSMRALQQFLERRQFTCDVGDFNGVNAAECRDTNGNNLGALMVVKGFALATDIKFSQIELLAQTHRQGHWAGHFEPARTLRPGFYRN